MDRTRVELSPGVKTKVQLLDGSGPAAPIMEEDAFALLNSPGVLVIDGIKWTRPLETLRRFQEGKRREFDTAFRTETPEGLEDARRPFNEDLGHLFEALYGDHYTPSEVRNSWRPMISGPEPLHFDSVYVAGCISLTAYLNVSDKPREYCISHSLPKVMAKYGDEVRQLSGGVLDPWKTPVALRNATLKGKGPLGKDAPRHRLWFAPGSVWIFDPKRVSHELVYGEGAICSCWVCPADSAHLPETWLSNSETK